MSKSNYTEAMVAEMQAIGAFNYESAVAFAEKHGLKVRSVIAKAKSLELPYEPKPVVTKAGEPVERKSEIVAEIASAIGVSAEAVQSMVKMTKADLNALRKAVA